MVPSIYIPGTTPHCLVSTEGNVNFLGTRNLVWGARYCNQQAKADLFK